MSSSSGNECFTKGAGMVLMRSDSIGNEKPSFEPSRIILPRILRTLLESGSLGRTALAAAANTSYPKLAKHLVWLESMSYVEFSIENGKLTVRLTQNGREFALKVANIQF